MSKPMIRINWNRKNIAIIVGLVTVLILGGISAWQVGKKNFRAFEEPISAEVSVTILDRGRPTVGMLQIAGDCLETVLPSINSSHYCKLLAPAGAEFLKIYSLAFFNYKDDQTLVIPLRTEITVELEPFLLQPNERLILRANITDSGLSVSRLDETAGRYSPFPPQ